MNLLAHHHSLLCPQVLVTTWWAPFPGFLRGHPVPLCLQRRREGSPHGSFWMGNRGHEQWTTLEGDWVFFPVLERPYFSALERGLMPLNIIHLTLLLQLLSHFSHAWPRVCDKNKGWNYAGSLGNVSLCFETVTCYLLSSKSVQRPVVQNVHMEKKKFPSAEDFCLLTVESIKKKNKKKTKKTFSPS